MIIFYFNGFGERRSDRTKILSKFGDEVHILDFNFYTQKHLISLCCESVRSLKRRRENEALLVGDSLGAYMAFHTSNQTNTPSLLFNPYFNFKNGAEFLNYSKEYKEQQILFSEKNEFIDIKSSIKYLNSINIDSQISILEGIDQNIPIDVFDKYFSFFREKYKVENKKTFEKKIHFEESIFEKPPKKIFGNDINQFIGRT